MKFHIYIPQDIEDIGFDIEIDLSDSEIKEIRELVAPLADLDCGLIPLLEDKDMCMSEKGEEYSLYNKFIDAIFPKVFVELLIDGLENGNIKKSEEDKFDDLHQADPELLYDIYAPYVDMSTSNYVCEIPKELIPKVYLTKESTNEDIHRYLKREQQDLMWSLYHNYYCDSLFEPEYFDYSSMWWVEDCLAEIVSARIKEVNPEELISDDYNPLSDVNGDNLSTLYQQARLMCIDDNALKNIIVERKSKFYENICKDYNQSPLDMVVEYMFKIIDAQVDGMGYLPTIKIVLNQVWGDKELSEIDKYYDLNVLLNYYEPYLKRIYYLIHGETLKISDGEGHDTFIDAIMAFPSIRELRYSPKQEHRLLSSEMKKLRNLRNEMCYSSPVLTEKQFHSALDMVTDMYIFITAAEMNNIIKSSKSL